MKAQDTLFLAVDMTAGDPPTEFRIFSKGNIKTRKGAVVFDDAAAVRVMEGAQEFGADYPLDYGHAMLSGTHGDDPAKTHRAAGWFRAELRNGELWAANVRWTPTADKMLREKEYRYISPAFTQKRDANGAGHVLELLNVALTNVPATKGLAPLMASTAAADSAESMGDPTMIKLLATAMGMPGDSAESEVLERAARAKGQLDEIVRLSGQKDSAMALTTIESWKTAASRVVELEAAVETAKLDARKAMVVAKVKAKVAGGYLQPGREEEFVELGMSVKPELFEKQLDGLSVRVAREGGALGDRKIAASKGGPTDEPNEEELALCGYTSLDEFKKDSAKLARKGNV